LNLTPDEFINDPSVIRLIESGSPGDVIANVAFEVGADLTILGTHEYGTVHKRSEEHTSELQSLTNLLCRLLLEKKKPTLSSLHSPLTSVSLFSLLTPHPP